MEEDQNRILNGRMVITTKDEELGFNLETSLNSEKVKSQV